MTWLVTSLLVMMWILLGIVALLLLIVLIAVILASLPIRYEVKVVVDDETTAAVHVSYCFRLIYLIYEYRKNAEKMTLRIVGFRKKLALNKPESSRKKSSKKNDKKDESEFGGILSTIQSVLTYPHRKIIIDLCISALKKMSKHLKPKKIDISGVIGFEDPAHTGWLLGMYEALAGILKIRQNVRLSGDFNVLSTVVKLDVSVKGSVNIARLSWPIVWLAVQKPIRGLIWGLVKG